MDNIAIYTITTFEHFTKRISKRGTEYDYRERRTPAFFVNKEETIKFLKTNSEDLNELDSYPLAVIEGFEEGIYPHAPFVQWFEWNNDSKEYNEIEIPEEFKQIVNFGLG